MCLLLQLLLQPQHLLLQLLLPLQRLTALLPCLLQLLTQLQRCFRLLGYACLLLPVLPQQPLMLCAQGHQLFFRAGPATMCSCDAGIRASITSSSSSSSGSRCLVVNELAG
jgi:hypothetical protein